MERRTPREAVGALGAASCWSAAAVTAMSLLWVPLGYAVGLYEGAVGTGASIPFLFGIPVFLLVFVGGPLLALLGLALHALARGSAGRGAAWVAGGALLVHASVWSAVLAGPAPGI